MLPIIKRLEGEKWSPVSVLYITPLRALNRDMFGRFQEICSEAGISVGVRHGDTKQSERARQIRSPPDILITTPETLQGMLPTKYMGRYLKNIKVVVVDEIHELYYSKRGAQLSVALERLEERAGSFQRVGISATVRDDDTVAHFLCGERKCRIVRVDTTRVPEIDIELTAKAHQRNEDFEDFFGLDRASSSRIYAIAEHIKKSKSCIVFGNTRQVVEALGSRLVYLDSLEHLGGVGVHHGSLDKEEREELERLFKDGKRKAIISTSSLELGIDIGNVDFVVQYGSPKQALRLLQRMGRSGHSIKRVSRGSIIALNEIDYLESLSVLENAKNGELESFAPNFCALDVAVHQICGMLMENGPSRTDRILELFKKSFIYRKFDIKKLVGLLDFMREQRMVVLDGELWSASGKSRRYYYEHLSAIPDSVRFRVKNIANGRTISYLDEKFVLGNVTESSVFITKGLPWKVIEIEKDIITVEPSTDISAAVPDWYGEDIPVNFSVAQGVLKLLDGKAGFPEEIRLLIKKQSEYFTIKKETVFIEELEGHTILYTFLGTRGNEFLAKLLGLLISESSGTSINTKASPYLVYIAAGKAKIERVLSGMSQASIEKLAEKVIKGTSLFEYKFVEIAKRLGIVERDATLSKNTARKIIKIFEGTPLWEETYREIKENYFDYGSVVDFFRQIQNGEKALETVALQNLSPISDMIINSDYHTKELIMPIRPSESLLNSFVEFTASKKIRLLCTYCGVYFQRKISEVGDLDRIECPSCASRMVCMYTEEYKNIVSHLLDKKRLKGSEMEQYKEMMIEARLFSAYGGKAAVALATYGIGPKTAARALKMHRSESTLFYTDLIEAQKNFIKNKKYWTHR